MQGQDLRLNLWNSMLAQLMSCRDNVCICRDISAHLSVFRLCCSFVAIFLSFDHLLPFSQVYRDRKFRCHDITTTSLFSFFVVALSKHICLAFFLSYCYNKVLRCHDIRLLSPPHNCRNRGFHVMTDFSCLTLLFPI